MNKSLLLLLATFCFVSFGAIAGDFQQETSRIEAEIGKYGIAHGQKLDDESGVLSVKDALYVVRSLSFNPARELLSGQRPDMVHYTLNGIAYSEQDGRATVVAGKMKRFVSEKNKAIPQASISFAAYYESPVSEVMSWDKLENFIVRNDVSAANPKSWIFTMSGENKPFVSPKNNEITIIGMRIKNIVARQ